MRSSVTLRMAVPLSLAVLGSSSVDQLSGGGKNSEAIGKDLNPGKNWVSLGYFEDRQYVWLEPNECVLGGGCTAPV